MVRGLSPAVCGRRSPSCEKGVTCRYCITCYLLLITKSLEVGYFMKVKIFTGALILAVIALISGATILAVAAPGTQGDPFITLDYLINSFKPQIMAEVNNTEQELSNAIDTKINELESRIQQNHDSAPTLSSTEVFSVVTISNGQTLTCSVGAEIMLRVGTAAGLGSDPALINYTSGSSLSAGDALIVNNMYLVTIEGNGIKATSDTARILIRGNYTID